MKSLVTTEYRGVFAGKVIEKDDEKRTVVIEDAQMCVGWTDSQFGVLGLASDGPCGGCRIGKAVSGKTTLYGVTSVSEMTEKACTGWEKQPWRK